MLNHNTDLSFVTSETADENYVSKVFCGFHHNNKLIAKDIVKDLISACKCTVFYYEKGEPTYPQYEFEHDLSQMSVLVLVVSSDYLFSESFARDVLYVYAVKHMIPILPIVTEVGLESEFNKIFGNLQYILWHGEQHDITSIPYVEKLKNNLSQIFCLDKSRKEFRAAFDTGVFLSYRKKDRSYAQELMKLIHEDERCQGISIWYDEFLIPGEDFNQNIKNELESSSMMLLVVTPHIVEQDNYIIRTEYPVALSMQKSILPFQMIPTSQNDLDKFYEKFPPTISTEEAYLVHQAIISAVQKLGLNLLESSAEKEYIRGLAYLKGICVEKNKKIGLKKIIDSAQKGVPQAMQTLSLMYKNGDSIAYSVEDAVYWQKKYIETITPRYTLSTSIDDAGSLIESYFYLGEIYEQSVNYQAAIEAYGKIKELCQNEKFESLPEFIDFYITAQIKAGSLYILLGDYASARYHCFENAVNKRKKQLEQEEYCIRWKISLCQLYALISECCEKCRNRSDAKEYAVLLRNELADITDINISEENYFSLLNRLSFCKSQLAHLYVNYFEYETHKAFIFVGEAIEIAEKLVATSDCYVSKRQLVMAHINDGDQHITQNQQNHLMVAEAAYNKAYHYLMEMVAMYDFGFELRQLVARVKQKQGFVKFGQGNLLQAQALYEDALEMFRNLKNSQETLITRKDLYDCITQIGVLYQQQGKKAEEVEKLFIEAVTLAQENVKEDSLALYKKDEAAIHDHLSAVYKNQWDMDNAFKEVRMQVNLLRQVMEGTGMVGDLKLFVFALKSAMKIANFAGEFEIGASWQQELQSLYNRYKIYLDN